VVPAALVASAVTVVAAVVAQALRWCASAQPRQPFHKLR
jgi:hypothetical protein